MTSRRIGISAALKGLHAILRVLLGACPAARADEYAVSLSPGVKAVWDMAEASRELTPQRERVCINGLWRWQPAAPDAERPPAKGWGFFKVPGPWPGGGDDMQRDSQTVHAHPDWKGVGLAGLAAAWYEREIAVPDSWAGRRIALDIEYLNSYATVFVDGKRAGEVRFPGGELDLSAACRPGGMHVVSILVVALPLRGVMLSYNDTASARLVKGSVPRRGLCGDVYLVGTPPAARIADVRVDTSVSKGRITFDSALVGLAAGGRYELRARITRDGRDAAEFTSPAFAGDGLKDGRFNFAASWKPDRLWDLHTPGNQFVLSLSLHEAGGRALDTAHDVRFGFREFAIDGRDFILNGSRVYLSAVPLDNAHVDASTAGYRGARESLERLKGFGVNLVYTHNYGCEPGSHLGFSEILRAADDVGMLVAFSQHHFSHYDWKADGADRDNGYAKHAEFYVRQAQNHPSVVLYAMSHNATGYDEDMNPDLIDGVHDPRDTWARNNVKLATRAEAIVRRLDPGRIVYHHASGNLGSMHNSNFYPNFAPIQELSDWFEHWAAEGIKPMFTCEYGAPFTWDWSMYRGWYKGERNFGSTRVPWEFCFAEWNAQFLGDRAFRISEMERANLRWEAKKFRAGELWHRWDYPFEIGSRVFDDRHEVIGRYLTDNVRAYRTWGVSATSPWEFGHFWKPRDGVDRTRKVLPVDWDHLQRPGYSPDYLDRPYERMDLAFGRSDWMPTADGQALLRNNRPLLAYIGGPGDRFTSKDHDFRPGDTVDKQIIVINNSREPVKGECSWFVTPSATDRPRPPLFAGGQAIEVETGQQARVPIAFALPAALVPGRYDIQATVKFRTGEVQGDAFSIDVLPPTQPAAKSDARVALFDPKGETAALLKSLGILYQDVDADADLSSYDLLVVGKAALSVDGPAPGIDRVRDGLKVIVFEQTAVALEERLGFRVVEYGLRQVFPRVPDHPILAGIKPDHLHDWRGASTILAPRLAYELRPRYGPTVLWSGIRVPHLWRRGNRGNVASVLIEKPGRGDFLPILDGGFSLQYSPLMEYREGRGLVLFCQLDVSGRTEVDPAAEILARNLLRYATAWKPAAGRDVVFSGDARGLDHLRASGISAGPYRGEKLSPDQVLVVGPGGGRPLAAHAGEVADWIKAGGKALAIGLDEADAAFLPSRVRMKEAEHIAAFFEPFGAGSPFAGVGPADVHNRDPRTIPLVADGAEVIGDGVLASLQDVVFCQLVPWQFEYGTKLNVKRTYRRTSFLVSRLLANMGVHADTPLLVRFRRPGAIPAGRPREGYYLDQPEEGDDPYRFFRW